MGARTGFTLALLLVVSVIGLAATLLIHRGFRARSAPTASEAYIARKIRNFAIPSAERRSKSLLDPTASNLEHARELFRAIALALALTSHARESGVVRHSPRWLT